MPNHGDVKIGIFNPRQPDTLRSEFRSLIGIEFRFEYAWTMDSSDPFPGQAAWRFEREQFDADGFPGKYDRWFPDEDIEG